MSIKTMSRVWEESAQEGSALLLLLSLADHATDDGIAWPGYERLALRTRRSERHVKRLTAEIAEDGELYIAVGIGRNHTNMYLVATGMTAVEIEGVLVKRFGVERLLARQTAAAMVAAMTKKGGPVIDDVGDTVCETAPVHPLLEKVTPAREKVTPARRSMTPASPEPSLTVKEPLTTLKSDFAAAVSLYENRVGVLSSTMREEMADLWDDLVALGQPGWCNAAIEVCYEANAVNWRYMRAVLRTSIAQKSAPGSKPAGAKTYVKKGSGNGNGNAAARGLPEPELTDNAEALARFMARD
jgi:hypothetical protein